MPPPTDPTAALVVASAPALQQRLITLLARSGLKVVGAVTSGRAALTAAEQLRPAVIVIDVDLPDPSGCAVAQRIMQRCPAPIVLVSTMRGEAERHTAEALAVGALAVVQMPAGSSSPDHVREQERFGTMVRLMASVPVVTRFAHAEGQPKVAPRRAAPASHPRILAVAASTGGPQTLQRLLSDLGGDFPLPIVVVQHITVGFTATMVEWLARVTPLHTCVAQAHTSLQAGCVYVAPDSAHLTVTARGQIMLRAPSVDDRYCPSANRLFASVASAYGASAIGVILTGMGDDGAEGLCAVRAAGGLTLAQDAASCVVPGMPMAAVERGAIDQIRPLAQLAGAVLERMPSRQRQAVV